MLENKIDIVTMSHYWYGRVKSSSQVKSSTHKLTQVPDLSKSRTLSESAEDRRFLNTNFVVK